MYRVGPKSYLEGVGNTAKEEIKFFKVKNLFTSGVIIIIFNYSLTYLRVRDCAKYESSEKNKTKQNSI